MVFPSTKTYKKSYYMTLYDFKTQSWKIDKIQNGGGGHLEF